MTVNCPSRNIGNSTIGPAMIVALAIVMVAGAPLVASAQTMVPAPANSAPAVASPGVVPPAGYTIGTDDVLQIVFWRDKDMSADVVVRPDGQISLPLLGELRASGLKPEELRDRITTNATRFVQDPRVTVVVKQINSRKGFITGQVQRPGAYPLNRTTTVLQLISMAGGLLEYAKSKEIVIMRSEDGRQVALKFNYKDVLQGRNLGQNVELKPGDTVVVP